MIHFFLFMNSAHKVFLLSIINKKPKTRPYLLKPQIIIFNKLVIIRDENKYKQLNMQS